MIAHGDLGRWISRDPIEEQGGLNLFAYVRNQPDRYVDPRGENWNYVDFELTGRTACCKCDRRITATKLGESYPPLGTCVKNVRCPGWIRTPEECCGCCNSCPSYEYLTSTLVGARWGSCCFCTLTIRTKFMTWKLPHAVLDIECKDSEEFGPGFSMSIERGMAANGVLGPAPVSIEKYAQAGTYPTEVFQRRIPCDAGHRLRRMINEAYPKSSSGGLQKDHELDFFLCKNCWTFAKRWFDKPGKGEDECP